MLTQRQRQLLQFIEQFTDAHGVSPSFEEMRAALNLRSKSGIHRLISGLEERGYLRRLAYRARALEVVRERFTLGHVGGVFEHVVVEDIDEDVENAASDHRCCWIRP